MPYFEPIVEAFGYRNVRAEGKEADDVIGTLSTKVEAAGHSVCVVSTDRDAFQLASENVCIMMTPRGVADVVVYTPDRIIQRYGIGPDLDARTSSGSRATPRTTSPACPGSATRPPPSSWCGSGRWRASYANLDAVSGEKRRENLRAATDDAARSKVLATIDRALEIDVDFDDVVAAPPDRSTMKELFRKLEFRALLKRVDELEEAVPGAPVEIVEGVELEWREADLDDLRSLPDEVALAVGGGRAAVTGDGADVAGRRGRHRPASSRRCATTG